MNFALFGRFFLEFAMMYPAEYLCLASLQEHLRAPRKTYAIGASAITLMGLAGAAVCCMLDIETNFLLIPLLIISFWLLRWRTDREVSISQTMFLFSVSAVMMSVCTLLAVVLNAEAELDNAQPVFLPSTSVICLTLSVILSAIFRFTAVRWSRWLLQEYHGEAFWESAWPLPALYAAFLVFCMPKEIGIILMNRIRIIAVLAVSISLLGIFLLLYEMYRVAKEYARSSQLDRENQLDELKSYLSQYESELSDARPTLCANAAVDALAGHYDYEARRQGIQIEWKLELPKLLPLPEADLCTILGNLLENALHASQKLPPEERQIKVLARMLSPAMMGLMVENRYDGVLKKQGGVLHSTKHDGQGIGLVSVETAVHRYHGNLTVETGGNVFRANVLLNL